MSVKDKSHRQIISVKNIFYFSYGAFIGTVLSMFLVWKSEGLTLQQAIIFCLISGLASGLTFVSK